MSARWCEQHQRPECTATKRYTAEPCHSPPGKDHDACYNHRGGHYIDAHREVALAVAAGVLVKPDACELCGTRPATLHAHHEDHDRPLDVIWLCGACHHQVHRVHGSLPATVAALRAQVAGAERLLASRAMEAAP